MRIRGRSGTTHDGCRLRRCAVVAVVLAAAGAGVSACGSTSASSSGATAPGPAAASPTVPAPAPSATAPTITHRLVRERETIPFPRRTRDSSSLDKGVVRVAQAGRPGVRVLVYRVTRQDGVATRHKLIRKVVARPPVAQIKLQGTYVAPPKPSPTASPKPSSTCDPNYSGACVPVASDVDCGGGSGDGPAYVYGTVRVVGSDIYGLDSDGDGYGCE